MHEFLHKGCFHDLLFISINSAPLGGAQLFISSFMYDSPLGKLPFLDQGNTNRLHFFASLFEVNDVVYLDPQRHYCILKSETYLAMRQELTNSLANHKKLERELVEAQMNATAAVRQAKVYREKLEAMSRNIQTLKQQYEKASIRIKELERLEAQWKNIPKMSQTQRERQEQVNLRRQNQFKSYSNESCQTEWQAQQQSEPQLSEEMSHSSPHPQIETVQQQLSDLLQAEMQKFEQQFQRKVEQLKHQRLSIDQWQQENRQLREQNQKLRQQMVERNIEEEKLQTWKSSVAGFIDRIQSSIVRPRQEHREGEEQGGQMERLREEVVQLRGRIVEMRSRMRAIDEMMEGKGEVEDEGAIGVLVRLSRDVKSLVKNMVMEVEDV